MDQMKDTMRLHRTSDFIHRALDTKLRTRKNAPAYIAWRDDRMPDLPDDPATLQIANEIYIETMKILSEINELQVACYKNTRFDRTSKRLDRLIVASQDNHRRFCDELQRALLTSIMYHNDSADAVLSEQSDENSDESYYTSEDDTPRPQTKTKKERDTLTTTPKSAARKPSPVKHTSSAAAAAPASSAAAAAKPTAAQATAAQARKLQIAKEMAELQNQLDDLSRDNTMIFSQKSRQASASTAMLEQVLRLTRSKDSITRAIEVLQAEYVFHITYEDETTECLEMDLPDDITPAEIQILQSGAATIMKDTSLSRERRAAGRCFYHKLDALLTTMTSKHAKRSAASSKRA